MEVFKQQTFISDREIFNIIEIKVKHRLKFFSYTYYVKDKTGTSRPVVRWDNFNGQIHYDTFDASSRLFQQKPCQYKKPREILQLIRIFRQNLANMNIDQL